MTDDGEDNEGDDEMATFEIKKATRSELKARVALIGVSGSGKTYDALLIAAGLARRPDGTRGRIIVIDTENRSASKYAKYAPLGVDFDVIELDTFAPETYVAAIHACEEAGAASIVIDSLSHAWMGKDGALEMKDKATAASRSGNSFDAWRTVTPKHNALVDALLRCKAHLVATMRAKTEYLVEEVNGRKTPRKVGLAPVQRDGLEYEFDVVAEVNIDHQVIITKSRCSDLAEVGVYDKSEVRKMTVTLRSWLAGDAADAADAAPTPKPATAEPSAVPQPAPLALPADNGAPPSRVTPARAPDSAAVEYARDAVRGVGGDNPTLGEFNVAVAEATTPAPSDTLKDAVAQVLRAETPAAVARAFVAAEGDVSGAERTRLWRATKDRAQALGVTREALDAAVLSARSETKAAPTPPDEPPPDAPKGRRRPAAKPSDATGDGAAANDATGAPAAWLASEDATCAHLAAKSDPKALRNSAIAHGPYVAAKPWGVRVYAERLQALSGAPYERCEALTQTWCNERAAMPAARAA